MAVGDFPAPQQIHAAFTPDQEAHIQRLIQASEGARKVDPDFVVGRQKVGHVGAPAIFALTLACQDINRAFGGFGCYLVGSALERPNWRDVDVRFIMGDDEFRAEFPGTLHDNAEGGTWEFDPKWILLTVSLSERLSKLTGLPIDFQFQPQTHANKVHKGPRNALGLIFSKKDAE